MVSNIYCHSFTGMSVADAKLSGSAGKVFVAKKLNWINAVGDTGQSSKVR